MVHPKAPPERVNPRFLRKKKQGYWPKSRRTGLERANDLNLIIMKKLLLLLFLMLLVSCKENKKKETSDYSILQNNLDIPTFFDPEYTVKEREDLSHGNANRRQLRITVPTGLTKELVEYNIKEAVFTDIIRNGRAAVSVLVYKDKDSVNRAYTVAMGEFVPGGKWENANDESELKEYILKVEFAEGYFKSNAKPVDTEEDIVLFKDEKYDKAAREFIPASHVPISNSIREWTSEHIIIEVPNGIETEVVDTYRETILGGYEIIRHKVKVTFNGKEYQGWVHGEEVIQK